MLASVFGAKVRYYYDSAILFLKKCNKRGSFFNYLCHCRKNKVTLYGKTGIATDD